MRAARVELTRAGRGLWSAPILAMLLAVGIPVVADEQPEEVSTSLPPGIVLARQLEAEFDAEFEAELDADFEAELEAAAPDAAPVLPELAELIWPPALKPRLEPRIETFDDDAGPFLPAEDEQPDAPSAAASDHELSQQAGGMPVGVDESERALPEGLEPISLSERWAGEPRWRVHDGTEQSDGADDDPWQWGPPPPAAFANEFGAVPIRLLGREIAPGSRERLYWTTGQSFSGNTMETPVMVLHGVKPGPRLCLTAGIHGDELNGIEVVRRLAYTFEPEQLSGTVVAVPIVNLLGFARGSRYLPDRRDLNRFFPGNPIGSSASRIANSFFTSIISHCDALVDIHTGSMDRANLPQVRGDLTNPLVLEFTRGFGATAVLHSPGEYGMLRIAASARDIPAVTFEIGGPLRLQPEEIEHGVQAIETLLNKMGMVEQRRRWREPQAVYYESRWVRVDHGGMLLSEVALGDRVRAGQLLGRVIDPVSNRSAEVLAPDTGRIIGMALNQLVLPGFAAFNLGIAASEEQVVIDALDDAAPDDERYLEYDQLDHNRELPEDFQPYRDVEPGDDPEF